MIDVLGDTFIDLHLWPRAASDVPKRKKLNRSSGLPVVQMVVNATEMNSVRVKIVVV